MDTIIALTCFYSGSPPAPSNDTSPYHNSRIPRIPRIPGNPSNPSNPSGSKPVDDDDAASSPEDPKTTPDRISDAISILYAVIKSICHVIDSTDALRNIYKMLAQAVDRYGGAVIAIRFACRRL
jgi:hypothetical protein